MFTQVLLGGQKKGPPGSPVAMETVFGWVLCGDVLSSRKHQQVITYHTVTESGDDIIRKFWEIEETPGKMDCFLEGAPEASEAWALKSINSKIS